MSQQLYCVLVNGNGVAFYTFCDPAKTDERLVECHDPDYPGFKYKLLGRDLTEEEARTILDRYNTSAVLLRGTLQQIHDDMVNILTYNEKGE